MIWLVLILLTPGDGQAQNTYIRGMLTACDDTFDLTIFFDKKLSPRNQYALTYLGASVIEANSEMILRFDSEASLKLVAPITARIMKLADDSSGSNAFIVTFTLNASYLRVQVFGPPSGYTIPYVTSVMLNDVELCKDPTTGYLHYATEKPKEQGTEPIRIDKKAAAVVEVTRETHANYRTSSESCGRRKLGHTKYIVHGEHAQPGDWPWHVAILKLDGTSIKYICGGTLLSKTLVLTAAHCATYNNDPVTPQSLSIVLGKYNLIGGDISTQEKGVFQVIVHYAFDERTLNHDIALLRLKSEAVFDEYVQPACLWHKELPNYNAYGKVVGWGFNHKDTLSQTLQQITVPIVSELTCLKSNPIFFSKELNDNKFCAGFANGTSPCNGDSGGGLMIFVPDTTGDYGKESGAWYVRGIVSLGVQRSNTNICDPYEYTIFTDVTKYRDWVMSYLN